MKKILITGGAGFIGSNFIKYFLNKYKNYEVINLDKLTYAGNVMNLADLSNEPRYRFICGSITDEKLVEKIFEEKINYVINFAAESHVDRSILGPMIFANTNILGTQTLLEAGRKHGIDRFIQISTDEVYGSVDGKELFTEKSPLDPSSPYSSSKASADLIALSYHKTYGFPVIVTRCSNNYGPYQFPEKLIPLMITRSIEDKKLPVYGDGTNVRDWIHVLDHCRAIDAALHRGRVGEVYNIGANNERTNLEIVITLLEMLGKPKSLIEYVKDRPGHDKRYAIDNSKITNDLGWKPKYNFKDGIYETVKWYLDSKKWWQDIASGKYLIYNKSSH